MNVFARAALALLMLSAAAKAAVPGSDHALVGRYEGSELVGYGSSEYDEVEVIISADVMRRDIQDAGKVDLYGIQFDFDRATIRPESRPTLDEVARLLREDTALRLDIVGHTDAQGDADYNQDLSRRRAAAVADTLVRDYAVDSTRLRARGAGAAEPLASNNDEAGRQKNRRVELARRH